MNIIQNRLQKSIGKKAIIFLNNGWKYSGKITNCDEKYVEILRDKEFVKDDRYKIILIDDIKDIDVIGGENG